MGGSESKINVVYGKIQISFFVGSSMAANFTPEGEGLAGEGWNIKNRSLGSMLEKIWTTIGTLMEIKELSDTWTGCTRFTILEEKSLDGKNGPEGD